MNRIIYQNKDLTVAVLVPAQEVHIKTTGGAGVTFYDVDPVNVNVAIFR